MAFITEASIMPACRICLSETTEYRFKFEVESSWSHLFEYCVGLTISKESPRVLCNDCLIKLRDYASFKSQCLQSDMMWKQLSYPVKSENPSSLDKDNNAKDLKKGNSQLDSSDSFKIETEQIEPPDNCDSTTIAVSETKTLKRKPRQVSKSKSNYCVNVRQTKLQSSIKQENKEKNRLNSKGEEYCSEIEQINKKKLRKRGRPSIIPMKITPYTDKEKLDRRLISKTTNIQRYLESIGKADENYMSEKEFLQKYYNELPSETRKKQSKSIVQAVYGCRQCDKKILCKKVLVKHAKVCSGDEFNVILDHELKELLRGPTLPVSDIVYCGICQFSSENSDTVSEHWKEHVASNSLDCQLCHYTGRDMADMVAHRFKHHPPDLRHWIKCPICSLCHMQVNRLEYHYRSVHLNKKGGLCSYCGKEFMDYQTWISHQIKHTVDRFICDHCGRNFMHRHDIEYHLNIVLGTKKFTCETCGKGFKRLSNLKLHINGKHTVSEPLKCDHCGRLFKTKHTYSNHIREIRRPKCFCEICGKEIYEMELKNHMMKHSGVRPFKCDLCSTGFILKNQLRIHMRVHTKRKSKKAFPCDKCDKSFTALKTLKEHQRLHSGDRTVKCPYCSLTYYDTRRMRYHCKLKHHIVIKDEPK